MNMQNSTPSLFDDGQIGTGTEYTQNIPSTISRNLIDLLYDGFYLVFLIRNGYIPHQPEQFRFKVIQLLEKFEQHAKKLDYASQDIQDAKYAFCALIDETIAIQQDSSFFDLQNFWLNDPLQLKFFGNQLAGGHFFEILEQLRMHGKERLEALEVFHYCLLLGFQGKYRIASQDSINHLISRTGDEIDFLRGKKHEFSPFAALPDQVRNILHNELPFIWILVLLLVFSILSFAGLKFTLNKQSTSALMPYQNVINTPVEQAHITIHLP